MAPGAGTLDKHRAEHHDPSEQDRLEILERAEKLRYQVTPASLFPIPVRFDLLKKGEPGPLTGSPLVDVKVAGTNYIGETYVDIGPLVVKTLRGDIKAQSGDIIIYFEPPDAGPNEDVEPFLHVIPWEIAEIWGVLTSPVDGGATSTSVRGASTPSTPTPPVPEKPKATPRI